MLDAKRVQKKGMEALMNGEKLNEYVEKYALYEIELV